MRRLRSALPDAVDRGEVLRDAAAHRAFRYWEEVVGETLAAKSWPDRFDKGTVWVAVSGSAWAQELRLRREMILQRLREIAGDRSLFTDVRFGVRKLPARPEIEPEVAAPTVNYSGLSIREIRERRLKMLAEDEGTN